MKRLKKITAVIAAVLVITAILALPAMAASTSGDQVGLELKEYNVNDIARVVINTIVGLLIVVGVVVGGWHFAQGFIGQDPKERSNGLMTMIGSGVIGALILVVVNMILK